MLAVVRRSEIVLLCTGNAQHLTYTVVQFLIFLQLLASGTPEKPISDYSLYLNLQYWYLYRYKSAKHSEEQLDSRQNLLKIISNMRFLARQALLFRGHGNVDDSNFTQLYLLREEDNESLKTFRT
jgi:hypothetical protein